MLIIAFGVNFENFTITLHTEFSIRYEMPQLRNLYILKEITGHSIWLLKD